MNYDGSELTNSPTYVDYDVVPSYNGPTPTKPATDEHTYVFIGWTPELAAVTGNATYTATFGSSVNNYEVTIVADPTGFGTVSQTKVIEVPYGTQVHWKVNSKSFKRPSGNTKYYQIISDECCNHFHLKCKKCGKTVHLDCKEFEEANEHISIKHKFKIVPATILDWCCFVLNSDLLK